jgi:hypothetical protein
MEERTVDMDLLNIPMNMKQIVLYVNYLDLILDLVLFRLIILSRKKFHLLIRDVEESLQSI